MSAPQSGLALNHPDDVWMFDIDGTLIGSIRSDVLRPGVPELIGVLRSSGTIVTAWSAGGAEYARRMLSQFGIGHHFAGYYDKDVRGDDGRYLLDHIPLMHRPGTLVDDYPDDVPAVLRVIAVRQFLGGNPADDGLAHALEVARGIRRSRA